MNYDELTDVKQRFFYRGLARILHSRVLHFGVPKNDAIEAAEVLASADLRGIDSHGVARLHSYFDMLMRGRINPKPEIKVVRSTLSTATVDGDNGLGLVVGPQANRIAMDMAEKVGSGWVSVRNTNHFGIAGYYVLKALERDLIGWAMTNSTMLVAPLWGAQRMLGTNPIAIAFPARKNRPLWLTWPPAPPRTEKLKLARRRGEPIPEGWAIDSEGRPQPIRMTIRRRCAPASWFRSRPGRTQRLRSRHYGGRPVRSSKRRELGPFAPPFALRQEIPKRSVARASAIVFGAMRIGGFMVVIHSSVRSTLRFRSFRPPNQRLHHGR